MPDRSTRRRHGREIKSDKPDLVPPEFSYETLISETNVFDIKAEQLWIISGVPNDIASIDPNACNYLVNDSCPINNNSIYTYSFPFEVLETYPSVKIRCTINSVMTANDLVWHLPDLMAIFGVIFSVCLGNLAVLTFVNFATLSGKELLQLERDSKCHENLLKLLVLFQFEFTTRWVLSNDFGDPIICVQYFTIIQ